MWLATRRNPRSDSHHRPRERQLPRPRDVDDRGVALAQNCGAVCFGLRAFGEECFIDATFVMAKGGGSEIGTTKRGKGMKIMAIVERHGLPLSVSTHAANHHEVRLVQLCFDFYMIEAKPENLIGDRAYDSDPLDEELRNNGIEMIAPHRSNRSKPPTQDRRRLSRYTRRWLVERFFAWIQWQRRILVRWEYHAQNFLGFVQLACLVILFRRF